jgi:hypothetical protein
MGVHDLSVYKEVKALLEIPEDEPIFILRSQDILYPAAVAAYEQLYVSACRSRAMVKGEHERISLEPHEWMFAEHVEACRDNGARWQKRNFERVKFPD